MTDTTTRYDVADIERQAFFWTGHWEPEANKAGAMLNQLLTDNAALKEQLETVVDQAAADAFAFADEKDKLKAELEQVKAAALGILLNAKPDGNETSIVSNSRIRNLGATLQALTANAQARADVEA